MKDSGPWSKTIGRLTRPRPGHDGRQQDTEDAEAERRTDAALRRLPEGWMVSGLPGRGGGPTRVVVGPGGVDLLASHLFRGCVRVKEGVPWVRRGSDAADERPGVGVNRKVIDPARQIHRDVRARSGRSVPVHPVVVLWSEFPQRVAETSQIAFVQGRDLASWLQHREVELDPEARVEVSDAVAQSTRGERRRAARLARRHAA